MDLQIDEAPPTSRDLAPRVIPSKWKTLPSVHMPDGGEGLRWGNAITRQTVIMSVDGRGPDGLWWHVSTARPDRLPNWDEVVEVKETFMGADVCAIHLIPPRRTWLNHHPNCLHLWVRLDRPVVPPGLYESKTETP